MRLHPQQSASHPEQHNNYTLPYRSEGKRGLCYNKHGIALENSCTHHDRYGLGARIFKS